VVVVVVTVVPTPGDWLSFKDVERATGIPSTSLRRFVERFPGFLAGKRINRALCFHPDAVATFRRISELFREGKTTPEVAAILATEQTPTIDVKAIPTNATTVPTVAPTVDMAALAPLLDRFTAALERIAENGARALETMERRLAALETIAARMALPEYPQDGPKRPSKALKVPSQVVCPPHGKPGLKSPTSRSRTEIIAEVMRLRKTGIGAVSIAKAMTAGGWPTLSGRGRWADGVVKRIIKAHAFEGGFPPDKEGNYAE
jgi:hypothetical protein